MSSLMKERVNKGVAFLDEKSPGWYKKLNLDTLNLHFPQHCPFGQTFDCTVASKYFDKLEDFDISQRDYGFVAMNDYNNNQLTSHWKEVIKEKLDADKNLSNSKPTIPNANGVSMKSSITLGKSNLIPKEFKGLLKFKKTGMIVLFVKEQAGTVIIPGEDSDYKIGDFSNSWNSGLESWEVLPSGTKITIEV